MKVVAFMTLTMTGLISCCSGRALASITYAAGRRQNIAGFLGRAQISTFRSPISTKQPLQQIYQPKSSPDALFARRMSTLMAAVRVRFAPSPTGTLHVGGARTALYNYLVARQHKDGVFVLRIEDTDTARSTRESEESMLADLRFLGLDWDEGPDKPGAVGPYRQSERIDVYKKVAQQLLESGDAYPCFCTEEELEAKRQAAEAAGKPPQYDRTWRDADPALVKEKMEAGEPYTVRFKVAPGRRVEIDDAVRGTVGWDADATVGDFILLRSSGMPVYNFCVAVDDALMGITTVIRAEEHLTNTLRQCLILEALKYPAPKYAHCSLILGEDRSKLSKRHGATSVDQFRAQGFLPDAMLNYLALLGWNDGTEQEVFSRQELIDRFSLNRVVKSPSVFDMAKLRWVNGQHLRALPDENLVPLVGACLEEEGMVKVGAEGAAFVSYATQVAKGSMELVNDAATIVGDVLTYPLEETLASGEADALVAEGLWEMAREMVSAFEANEMPRGKEEDFAALWKAWVKAVGKKMGRKGKQLFHPMRLALTGRMSGPDVGEQIRILHLAETGATKVVDLPTRIEKLREVLRKAPVEAKEPVAG
jgi:glutamyl-tRNA synthetase